MLLFNMIASLSDSALTLKYITYSYSELPVISMSVSCDVHVGFIYLSVGFF